MCVNFTLLTWAELVTVIHLHNVSKSRVALTLDRNRPLSTVLATLRNRTRCVYAVTLR